MSSPASSATMPPSARNGPSARCILRARSPLLGSTAIVGTTTEKRPTMTRHDDVAPEEEAEHERELDVADPDARTAPGAPPRAGTGRRRTPRCRARAGRRARSAPPSATPDDGERQRDAVGDDPVAQVDRADADEREREHERRDQLARRAEAPSDRAARDRRDEHEHGTARDAARPGGCSSSSSEPCERAMSRGSSGSQASAPGPPPTAASAPTAALIRPAPRGA